MQFVGMLPRPSLSWCFPIRELSFEQKQQQHNTNTSGMVFVWRGILFGVPAAARGAAALARAAALEIGLYGLVTLGTFGVQF